jgi:hypothetical protein
MIYLSHDQNLDPLMLKLETQVLIYHHVKGGVWGNFP